MELALLERVIENLRRILTQALTDLENGETETDHWAWSFLLSLPERLDDIDEEVLILTSIIVPQSLHPFLVAICAAQKARRQQETGFLSTIAEDDRNPPPVCHEEYVILYKLLSEEDLPTQEVDILEETRSYYIQINQLSPTARAFLTMTKPQYSKWSSDNHGDDEFTI